MGSYKLCLIVDSRRLAAAPGPFSLARWPLAPRTCTRPWARPGGGDGGRAPVSAAPPRARRWPAAACAPAALVPVPAALLCLCRRPHLCLSAGIYWPRFDTRACCESPTRGFVSFLALLPLLAASKRRSTESQTRLVSGFACFFSSHIAAGLAERIFVVLFCLLPGPAAADPVHTHRSIN